MEKELDFKTIVQLIPTLAKGPSNNLNIEYDKGADTVYLNFGSPVRADDSELLDSNIVKRTKGNRVIGYTILNASRFI